jgi:type I restriction enzyme S subunit
VNFAAADRINETARQRVRKGLGRNGDILLTHRATVGRIARVGDGAPEFVANPGVTIWRSLDESVLDQGYLYCYMRSAAFMDQLWRQVGHTDTFDYVSLTQQRGLLVAFPREIAEQRSIARVLGALDDKIELNRRMNETLEAMARALFKSWFVDFDPVRAKAEGRKPAGIDAAMATLFPDRFEESELGTMPHGWAAAPVLEVADLISGGTPKTSVAEYWGGNIRWASAKDVSQCGTFFLLETERTITEAGVENSATKVLPADCVVVVARGATCGRFAVLAEPMAMNQTCYALRAKFAGMRWYLRFLAEGLLQRLVHQAHGSVFDTITTSTFELARVVVPPRQMLEAFEQAVDPLVERMRLAQRESATLARLRDTLLPKLLSGELRVRDAEQMVEQAV